MKRFCSNLSPYICISAYRQGDFHIQVSNTTTDADFTTVYTFEGPMKESETYHFNLDPEPFAQYVRVQEYRDSQEYFHFCEFEVYRSEYFLLKE